MSWGSHLVLVTHRGHGDCDDGGAGGGGGKGTGGPSNVQVGIFQRLVRGGHVLIDARHL